MRVIEYFNRELDRINEIIDDGTAKKGKGNRYFEVKKLIAEGMTNRRKLYESIGNEYGLTINDIESMPMIHFLEKFNDFAKRVKHRREAQTNSSLQKVRAKALKRK